MVAVGAEELSNNHPVRYASTPPSHTDVQVPRSAGMRESGLENEEGSLNIIAINLLTLGAGGI